MKYVPERGRIVVVDFEMAGAAVPPEMSKRMRPCVVIHNNKLRRGNLVTVVPLSTSEPDNPMPYHHLMSHLSFRGWPMEWGGQGTPRWAKCDYVTTVSLDRCSDPYRKIPYDKRQYVKVKAAAIDLKAIEMSVLWALGIRPPGAPEEVIAEVVEVQVEVTTESTKLDTAERYE